MACRTYTRITRRFRKAFVRSLIAGLALGCSYLLLRGIGEPVEQLEPAFAPLAVCIGAMLLVSVTGLAVARLRRAVRADLSQGGVDGTGFRTASQGVQGRAHHPFKQ